MRSCSEKLYKNSCNHLIFKINIISCLLVILLYNQIVRRFFFTVSNAGGIGTLIQFGLNSETGRRATAGGNRSSN